ncbi:hypothetical protein C8A03DRAFT_16972 [Achaetomium macrosporum]|uniref:Uncharacterized protein n=1 Tax=Achaetomium macrosporum TaxID=79813 RepID=A0AAN7C7I8_9PEZI|nr:hypothetical protein C8A03DRAFT_16972 [Achaetomium macrosporum]
MSLYPHILTFLTAIGAIGPALAQVATTISATGTIDLFVMESATTAALSVSASILSADPSRTETAYWIECPLPSGLGTQSPPCNYIHGASVTMNPTGMALTNNGRSSLIGTATGGEDGLETWLQTDILVHATATCRIDGTASASCTGQLTSVATTYSQSLNSTWGESSTTAVETISTTFSDVTRHIIPVEVTAGFENVPTSTTASLRTSRSSGGGAMATGQAVLAGVAGVAAVAGAVGLI